MNNQILTIIGPTAVGKTAIAVELANRLNGEIIGLDSRQIYFDMEIGTAQPTIEEQASIRHHLIGVRAPDEVITAGEYAKLVDAVKVDINHRGKLPIICGGAGLYYRALREGIFEGSASDLDIRKKLEQEYEQNPESLLERLKKIDPEYSKIVHINNKKRLVRALEIYELTGIGPTKHYSDQKESHSLKIDLHSVFLLMDRNLLFDRICKRTEKMLADGLVAEVKTLLSTYEQKSVHPLDSIGYKQVVAFLGNKISYDDMIEEINLRTRQYAKKQITWFKNEPIDLEVEIEPQSTIDEIVQSIISTVK